MTRSGYDSGKSATATQPSDPVSGERPGFSFVKDMAAKGSERAIVETIASLGHNLGIQVIAEGVETPAQLSLLEDMDCTHAQGFYFCTPVGSEDATELLGKECEGAMVVA